MTHIIFLIDQSGSMDDRANDVIKSYNSFLKEQKTLKNEADLTTVLFNDRCYINGICQPLRDTEDLTHATYSPVGMTALIDAIMVSITIMSNISKENDKVLFVVYTDGLENASRKYCQHDLNKKINEKKEAGWSFIYLCEDPQAKKDGATYGFSDSNTICVNAFATSIDEIMRAVSRTTTEYVTKGTLNTASLDALRAENINNN